MLKVYKHDSGISATMEVRDNSTDDLVGQEIWTLNQYFTGDFIVKPGDVVVDIGGNVGEFTILAAMLGAKHVHVYEPAPDSFILLCKNLERNNITNVTALQRAVWHSATELTLCIPEELPIHPDPESVPFNDRFFVLTHYGSSMISAEPVAGYYGVKVAAIPMCDILKKLGTIDFLKVDCEGSEYDILYSIPPKSLRRIKRLAIEYHNGWPKGAKLGRWLEAYGYNINWPFRGGSHGILLADRLPVSRISPALRRKRGLTE